MRALGWMRGGIAALVLTGIAPLAEATTGGPPPNAAAPHAAMAVLGLPREGLIDFAVSRNGSPIGHHRLTFTRAGDEVVVDVDIRLDVSLAFIPLYEYHHRNREVWRGGRLVRFETRTDDNGTDNAVVARGTTDGIRIEGSRFTGVAPGDLLPTSYWNAATIRAGTLINTQDGRLAKVSVADLGPDRVAVAGQIVDARHYRLSGDVNVDLWYDRNGLWVKTAFKAPGDGSLISYELVSPVTPAVPEDASATTAIRETADLPQP